MAAFSDYLLVFYSIIVGFVVAEFLAGWGGLIRSRRHHGFIHLGWTVLAFLVLIQSWWGSWPHRERLAQNFGYFLLSLSAPVGFYVLTIVLFPASRPDGSVKVDLRHRSEFNGRSFYFVGCALLSLFIVRAALLSDEALLGSEMAIRAVAALLFLAAAIFNNEKLRATVFVCSLLLLLVFLLDPTPDMS